MNLEHTTTCRDRLDRVTAFPPPLSGKTATVADLKGDHMASDITLAVGDGSRRMTYAELAQARGISLVSARRLARRHRWPRQAGNDGIVRILVPLGHLHSVPETTRVKPMESLLRDVPGPASAMSDGTSPRTDDLSDGTGPGPAYAMSHGTEAQAGLGHLRAFEKAIETLCEQLTKAERRADEVQVSERHALERVTARSERAA